MNGWADFWRYTVGANVIPHDSMNNKPRVEWKPFIDAGIPDATHNDWKAKGMFDAGMALVLGKCWHRPQMGFIFAVDCDNQEAVDYANKTLPLAELVKEHHFVPNKLHAYGYTESILENYRPDKDDKIQIELKAHAVLINCSPSIHKSGVRYTLEQAAFRKIDPARLPMPNPGARKKMDMDIDFTKIKEGEGGGRNNAFYHQCNVMMMEFRKIIKSGDEPLMYQCLWEYMKKWNQLCLIPPLDEVTAKASFESAKTNDRIKTDKPALPDNMSQIREQTIKKGQGKWLG